MSSRERALRVQSCPLCPPCPISAPLLRACPVQTPSPASTLLKKLADMGVTEAVSGLGKGKYRFKPIG